MKRFLLVLQNRFMELKQKNQTSVATVDISMPKCPWIELEYHPDILHAVRGSYVQVY